MADTLASLEGELKELQGLLDSVLDGLKRNPDDVDQQRDRDDLLLLIEDAQKRVEEAQPPPAAPSAPAAPPKWSKENHPAFQPGYKRPGAPAEPAEEPTSAPVALKVGDGIMAKWVTGDKQWYPASIVTILGSGSALRYFVKFKDYGNTETCTPEQVRPKMNAPTKRRADGTPVAPSPLLSGPLAAPPPPKFNPGVISAAAEINPEYVQQAKKEPSKVTDGPTRPPRPSKKVKGNKELDQNKSKWQDFMKSNKGAKKGGSMFKTGEGVNARGSGKAMTKDAARVKYRRKGDEEYDEY